MATCETCGRTSGALRDAAAGSVADLQAGGEGREVPPGLEWAVQGFVTLAGELDRLIEGNEPRHQAAMWSQWRTLGEYLVGAFLGESDDGPDEHAALEAFLSGSHTAPVRDGTEDGPPHQG